MSSKKTYQYLGVLHIEIYSSRLLSYKNQTHYIVCVDQIIKKNSVRWSNNLKKETHFLSSVMYVKMDMVK